jgi:hypothetical protein
VLAYYMHIRVGRDVGPIEDELIRAGALTRRRGLTDIDLLVPVEREVEEGEEPDEWEEQAFAELMAVLRALPLEAEVEVLDERPIYLEAHSLEQFRRAG